MLRLREQEFPTETIVSMSQESHESVLLFLKIQYDSLMSVLLVVLIKYYCQRNLLNEIYASFYFFLIILDFTLIFCTKTFWQENFKYFVETSPRRVLECMSLMLFAFHGYCFQSYFKKNMHLILFERTYICLIKQSNQISMLESFALKMHTSRQCQKRLEIKLVVIHQKGCDKLFPQ